MAAAEIGNAPILVRSGGDVGSAVAGLLFHAGYAVAIHDDLTPATSPRRMAFTDAVFDGVNVAVGTKIIEVDPRGDPSSAFGLGERPRRLAEGVCRALTNG